MKSEVNTRKTNLHGLHNPEIGTRVKKIKGQLNGIEKMIEENRYCIDVLTQISAVRSALDSLAMKLLEQHSRTCLVEEIKAGEEDKALQELMGTIKRLVQL